MILRSMIQDQLASRKGNARKRSPWIPLLGIITLVSWAPLTALVASSALAALFNCRLDEGSIHPCKVVGIDIGPALGTAFVAGWLLLVAWIPMLATAIAWAWILFRMLMKRRQDPQGRGHTD
jgi:hypothetical protein